MGELDGVERGEGCKGYGLVDAAFAAEELADCGPGFGRDVGDGEVFVDGHVDAAGVVFGVPVVFIS